MAVQIWENNSRSLFAATCSSEFWRSAHAERIHAGRYLNLALCEFQDSLAAVAAATPASQVIHVAGCNASVGGLIWIHLAHGGIFVTAHHHKFTVCSLCLCAPQVQATRRKRAVRLQRGNVSTLRPVSICRPCLFCLLTGPFLSTGCFERSGEEAEPPRCKLVQLGGKKRRSEAVQMGWKQLLSGIMVQN